MKPSDNIILASTRSMEQYRDMVAYNLRTFPEYYGGRSGEVGGGQIAQNLKVMTFADGEMEVEAPFSVRNRDVFLIAGSARNPNGISVSESKIELYHAIDCLKRGAPRRIALIEPYLSPSRSDRTTRRNSVGFWIHSKLLSSLGVDIIITYQLHSDKSKTAIDPVICQMEDAPAITMMMEYMARELIRDKSSWEDKRKSWVFCSVDAGGESMARKYAQAFDVPLIIAHKQRDYQTANTIKRINILSDTDIENKDIWIVDDMVDTGGSLVALVNELVRRNVSTVNVAAIHPVLSGPAISRLKELHDRGMLNELLFLDTIPFTEDILAQLPFVRVVSSTRQTAEIIMSIHENMSLSPFFGNFSLKSYLARPPIDD